MPICESMCNDLPTCIDSTQFLQHICNAFINNLPLAMAVQVYACFIIAYITLHYVQMLTSSKKGTLPNLWSFKSMAAHRYLRVNEHSFGQQTRCRKNYLMSWMIAVIFALPFQVHVSGARIRLPFIIGAHSQETMVSNHNCANRCIE